MLLSNSSGCVPTPRCGHCKKLAPIFERVGEAFSSDATITIAKMDATANDVPDARFVVKGFPSLYFYKADADKAGPYADSLFSLTLSRLS